MLIAVSAKDKSLDAELDPRFGRAEYFIVYDTENQKIQEIIDNNANLALSAGAGTSSAQLIAKKDVSALISGNFGHNAVIGLQGFNIKIYTSPVDTIKHVIENFINNKLTEISNATVQGKH